MTPIKFNTISPNIALNNSGTFSYYEEDANSEDPNFVLNGTITIIDLPMQSNNDSSSYSTYEVMSILMVPTKYIKQYTELLEGNKVNILSQDTFIDPRETGSGRANQTLLVLGKNGQMDDTVSVFKKITASLPYS